MSFPACDSSLSCSQGSSLSSRDTPTLPRNILIQRTSIRSVLITTLPFGAMRALAKACIVVATAQRYCWLTGSSSKRTPNSANAAGTLKASSMNVADFDQCSMSPGWAAKKLSKNYIAVGHSICCSYERRLLAPKGEAHEHTNCAKAVPN